MLLMSELPKITMYDPTRDHQRHQEILENALLRVARKGDFINGNYVNLLERHLEEFTGSNHCITCGNGTDALSITLKSLNIGKGDEVITVPLTWISSAEVISDVGAQPIWCDVRKETFCINEDLVEDLITEKTRAILAVSLYGFMPDYKRLREICDKHDLILIEDGAQSFGSVRDGNMSCSNRYTHVSTTSFFPTKPLGCFGDGGAIFTNNYDLNIILRSKKSHGGIKRFKHKYIGVNSRLDTIQASVLYEKLKWFNSILEMRDFCAKSYNELLKDSNIYETPTKYVMEQNAWAQYSLLCPNKEKRDQMIKNFEDNNIFVSVFYPIPLYNQECFGSKENLCPVTEEICSRIINLPCYGYVTKDELTHITNVLKYNNYMQPNV